MKRTLTLFAALVLLAVGAAAQKLSYSAVVRNSANELVANQTLTVTISIANSNGGPAVYSETHSGVQTNQNGLLTLVIGDGGSQAGSMSDVTWSTAYITSDYTMPDGAHVTNTVPVTAVPYALSAGNVEGGFEQVNADWNATSGAAQILNKPVLAEVATTGSYNSLSDKPTINNGTLTIQKNGVTVGNFTADQAGNTTVNITITPQDIINAVGEMTPEQKSQLYQALNCGGEPGPSEPTTFTCGTSTVEDHQQNVYHTVQIGTQCWTRENMRCTTSPKGNLTMMGSEYSYDQPYYYNNTSTSTNYNIPLEDRGMYYNWAGAMDTVFASTDNRNVSFEGRRGICPEGWHVPSDAEWTTLTEYVSNNHACNDNSYNAKALAINNEGYWNRGGVSENYPCEPEYDPATNNATGFSAVPSGYWGDEFYLAGDDAYFWSSSSYSDNGAYYLYLYYDSERVYQNDGNKVYGRSVRCLKDATGGTPTPPEPTPECPALGATTITPGTNPVAGSTTYLEIETVIDNYNPDLIDPSTAKFVVSYTVENQSDPISTTVENTYVDLIAVGDGIMYYGFEEQQVVTSITVTPYIALTGECASTTPISGVPSTYPNEVISSFTVNNAIISATNGLTCDLELVDANMNHAELSNVTIRVGNSSFTPSVTRMRSINEQYHLSVPYSDIENADLNLNDDVLEDVQVDFTYGDQTFSAANNNAVEADFAICSTLGATTVATTPATGDVVTFVATVDNSNDNITGKYFTITYMEGGVEQTFTLENSAVEINTDGNLVGHITETAATPLYGKTLTVVPTITLNSPCSNSEGQSLVYNMPGQTPTPGTFTCGDDLTVGTNTYPTVLIGTQCWTKTNMRETVGTQGSESSDTSFTAPYYYVHPTTGEYFYNWSAANQVCPTGWHLPSWEEFNNFLNFLNSRSEYLCDGLVAKAIAAQTGWFLDESTNQCYVNYEPATSNDATGFSALPVGVWNYGGSSHFVLESKSVGFWTSREDNGVAHGENGYLFSLEYNSGDIGYGNNSKLMGFSVRCLLDENSGGGETTQTEPSVTTEPATGVGQTAALLNGTLSNPSNVAIIAKGFEWKAVGAGSYTQVSVTGSYMSYTLTGLTASSEYIYRAFVTTASGTSYGQEVTFTTAAPPACPVLGTPTFCKQVGTNTVTIIIRTPIENYDADLISGIIYDYDFVLPGFGGGSIGSGGQSMATVDNVTNVDGNYVCVQQVELSAETWQANQSLMMSYSQTIEFSSNCDGSSSVTYSPDEVEVMAMPACESGTCPSLGATGTPGVSVSNSVFVTVITAINDYDANKIGLYSYRIYYTDDQYFVKYTDHGASISEAGLKVTFNPSVELPVPYASSVCTLRIVPVLNVICSDTAQIGEGVEYVYVPVFNCGTDNVFDVDGNEYATVLIGAQCWMKENLRTKHFPDGISIPVTANDSIFMSSCYYDYTSSSIPLAKRGLLYNWPAAMYGASSSNANPSGVQGICPNGWHVPSDAEWTQLTDYVSSQSTYRCGTGDNADNIASALASKTTDWYSSDILCAVGHNPESNNETGFDAFPAGFYFSEGYTNSRASALFISATETSTEKVWGRILGYFHGNVNRTNNEKLRGYSVRCLRD